MAGRLLGVMVGLVMMMSLGGCWMQGQTQKASYRLDKTKRVLIFCDPDPTVTPPAGFTTDLANSLAEDLFKYQAVDRVVAQSRLTELMRDQEKFAKMGIADVARETDAELVLYVRIVTLNITTLSDESLTQGGAQVLVKVIDATGKRLWPASELEGTQVDANVRPNFTENQDKNAVAGMLRYSLARDIGRLFHDWQKNESQIRRPK